MVRIESRPPARDPPVEAPPPMSHPDAAVPAEAQAVRDLAAAYEQMTEQIGKVIVGQNEVVEQLLMALFSRGHCLLVGVPGLAKTLLVSTVSQILHLSFKRIQFTPDLMPADITGTDILQDDPETGRRKFVFLPGPIFANMVLADEINRTPPKTQAALLEAMQEHHVTAGGQTYHLPEPFFVLATQNPIEQEGTYPLPEAQLDRFMFNIIVGYPSRDEELEIMKRTTSTQQAGAEAAARRRADPAAAGSGAAGGGGRSRLRLRRRPGAGDPAARAGRAEVRAGAGRLGRRAAGLPVPDPRRQGPGHPARPAARHHRRHPRGRLPGAAAPPGHHVQRRRRGHHHRRHHQAS